MAKDTSGQTLADLHRAKARAEEEIGAVLLALEERYGVTVTFADVQRETVWDERHQERSILEAVKLTLNL